MRVDGKLTPGSFSQIADDAASLEKAGYGALWCGEARRDPFTVLAIAGEHTHTVEIATGVAVAFARTPMTLAHSAWELQLLTGGRFILGLGSQVKPHIERRFSMPWSKPAARMREMIAAVRAIWSTWQNDEPLHFEGEFYTHTLMTPFFTPPRIPAGVPKIVLAAVGDRMTEVSGEVADGIILHGFTTEKYIREVTLPAIERGRAISGRSAAGFEVSGLPLTATGRTEEELAQAVTAVRRQIAFYGSTPSYRPVLELHGWGHLGDELHALSRGEDQDKWEKMGALIDDDVLNAFAVVGEPDTIPAQLVERYGDIMTRMQFYAPYEHDISIWEPMVPAIAGLSGTKTPA